MKIMHASATIPVPATSVFAHVNDRPTDLSGIARLANDIMRRHRNYAKARIEPNISAGIIVHELYSEDSVTVTADCSYVDDAELEVWKDNYEYLVRGLMAEFECEEVFVFYNNSGKLIGT